MDCFNGLKSSIPHFLGYFNGLVRYSLPLGIKTKLWKNCDKIFPNDNNCDIFGRIATKYSRSVRIATDFATRIMRIFIGTRTHNAYNPAFLNDFVGKIYGIFTLPARARINSLLLTTLLRQLRPEMPVKVSQKSFYCRQLCRQKLRLVVGESCNR